MAIELKVTVEQVQDGVPMSTSSHTFFGYEDVTDANLHNLSIQRALLDNAGELLVLKSDDPQQPGRSLSAAERTEVGAG